MGIVDRGSKDDRHPRSQWPAKPGGWRPRSRPPEPPPAYRASLPWMTYILAGLCIAVFLYGNVTGTYSEMVREWAYIPSQLTDGMSDAYVRLVTHQFLHEGWVHLLVNVVVFYSFGRGLEPAMGAGRFLVLYIVSGVVAALGHGFLSPLMDPINADVRLVGASGAISGILGAAVVAAPRMPIIFFIFPMPLFVGVIVLVALHIVAIVTDFDPGVAWFAHLAGLAAGALLYPLIRRRRFS